MRKFSDFEKIVQKIQEINVFNSSIEESDIVVNNICHHLSLKHFTSLSKNYINHAMHQVVRWTLSDSRMSKISI